MHPLPEDVVLPIRFGYASSKDKVNQSLKEELVICDYLEKGSWEMLHNRNKKLIEKQKQALKAAVKSESAERPLDNRFDDYLIEPDEVDFPREMPSTARMKRRLSRDVRLIPRANPVKCAPRETQSQ